MSTAGNTSPSPSSIDITEASPSLSDPLTEDQLSALEIHNLARSEVHVPPLSWSSSLAQEAQTWAEHLAGFDLGQKRGRLRMQDPGTNENVTVCLRDPPFRDPLSAAARRVYKEKERWPCRFARADGGEGRIMRECGERCSEVHMQYTQVSLVLEIQLVCRFADGV